MARTSKARDVSTTAGAPVGPGQEVPTEKRAAGGRRAAAPPKPTAGEQGTASAEATGRGRRPAPAKRVQGANGSGTKAPRGETRPPVPAPPPPPEPSPPPAAEVGADLRQLRLELIEALPLLQAVPGHVGEFRSCLKETGQLLLEAVRQLREAERGTRETREQLDRLRHESADAERRLAALHQQRTEEEGRLAALRHEASETEARLGALRRESADTEGILHNLRSGLKEARQALDEWRRQPPAAAPSAPTPAETHNRLGATVDPGVVVAEVQAGTPAANAGLMTGDVIVAVNGTVLFSGAELRDLVHEMPDGEEIILRVERVGLFEDVKVRLEGQPADGASVAEGHNRLGVTVEPGVVVAEVLPDSPAAHAPLLRGDVIVSVDGTPVHSGPQLRDLIHEAPAGAAVVLQVERGSALFEVRVPLAQETS